MASEKPEETPEEEKEVEFVVEQPTGLTLGDMEIFIPDDVGLAEKTSALAFRNIDGALYVLQAIGSTWINIEKLPKQKTATVRAIKPTAGCSGPSAS